MHRLTKLILLITATLLVLVGLAASSSPPADAHHASRTVSMRQVSNFNDNSSCLVFRLVDLQYNSHAPNHVHIVFQNRFTGSRSRWSGASIVKHLPRPNHKMYYVCNTYTRTILGTHKWVPRRAWVHSIRDHDSRGEFLSAWDDYCCG